MITPTPIVIALTFIGLSTSFSIQAETELRPIVTASRIAQTVDQTLSAVTVITREDIQHSQSQSVSEVLRSRVPGMDFLTTGGTGHQVSAFLRGTNSDHLLFIIDGNIIGSATTGAAQLELIPLEQVERIEIIRGPRSSLYGSDAIGGVIQVFTRSGSNQISASVTLGSNHTRENSIAISAKHNNTQFDISTSDFETNGFNVTNDNEHDDDGYRSDTVNLSVNHKYSSDTMLNARWFNTKGNTQFDNNSLDNESDSIQQSFTTGINSTINEHWNSRLDFGESQDRLETQRATEDFFSPGTFTKEKTLFETRRQQAHWQNEITIGNTGQFSFGADYLNDKVDSTTTYAETQRNNKALYLLMQNKFGRHQLQLSGRIDDNEAFGVHRTSNIAWSYDINGAILINLSNGTAFIAPSFNDLYYVDPFFISNPALNPEISRSTELGFSGAHHWGQWSYRLYHTEIENLIINLSTDPSDWAAPWTTANVDTAEIEGMEFEVSSKVAGWATQLNLAAINPRDTKTKNVLQNRARRTVKLNASKRFNDYRIGADIIAQSSRFANPSNTVELSGYNVINMMLEKSLDKHWKLETRLDNVLNKDYSTSIDFYGNTTNNNPIALFVTLNYLN